MRVLLDESLPRPLGRLLTDHVVRTVAQEGWASLENGELLREAAPRFDVLLTADQNLEFQQNVTALPIAVIVLVAESNRLESLETLVTGVLDALSKLQPKTLVRVRPLTSCPAQPRAVPLSSQIDAIRPPLVGCSGCWAVR